MCRLCTEDEQKKDNAIKEHIQLAEDFEWLAAAYRAQAHGRLDPHQDNQALIQAAKRLAIELVTNW